MTRADDVSREMKRRFAAVDRDFYELSYQLSVNVCVITVRFVDWIPTTIMNFSIIQLLLLETTLRS